ncbi:MAG: electron transfer flavoprotein subunit alpha [Gemmatimonadota bacterium]|nr:electron transfer flavoprotein subunit alpha [Gemmatimonadota bacterium]
MDTILFLAHTESDGTLGRAALETLTGAADLARALPGATFMAGLIGGDVTAAENAISGCGAAKIFTVAGADFAMSRYASDAAALDAICRAAGATIVVAPATARFNRVMPGVAQRLGGCIDTHVAGFVVVDGALRIQRGYYRQRMVGTLTRAARPWCLTFDGGVFAAWSGAAAAVPTEAVAVTLGDAQRRTTVVGFQAPPSDAQTIRPDANLLFVAGVGWTKKQSDGQVHLDEAAKIILGFLDRSKASLGSSKSLVDQSSEGQNVFSFMSHLNQVGQTGATPRHPKGLAACCHGEEPHVVGWRFIGERRAINLDPNCGWAQGKADVLYVADAFALVTKVGELL